MKSNFQCFIIYISRADNQKYLTQTPKDVFEKSKFMVFIGILGCQRLFWDQNLKMAKSDFKFFWLSALDLFFFLLIWLLMTTVKGILRVVVISMFRMQ